MKKDTLILWGLLGLGAYLILRNPGIARNMGTQLVNVADEAIGGAIEGIGDLLGVPRTNAELCRSARRDGRTRDVSFYCTAPELARYAVNADDEAAYRRSRSAREIVIDEDGNPIPPMMSDIQGA